VDGPGDSYSERELKEMSQMGYPNVKPIKHRKQPLSLDERKRRRDKGKKQRQARRKQR
jgi:hypothetical protein